VQFTEAGTLENHHGTQVTQQGTSISIDFVRPVVKVSFNITTHEFTFVDNEVTMKFAGKIILVKSPGNAPWRFQGAMVRDDTLHQFRETVEPQENAIHIFDELRDTAPKAYIYNVTVEYNGVSYTCSSPVIVNDPQ
jgi:hypothetical protein